MNTFFDYYFYISLGILGLIVLIFLIVYFPRLKGWFSSIKPQKYVVNEKKNKIALIIPARNEAAVIGSLLDTCLEQTYDRNYYDMHVIVKDPSDIAIGICHSKGAYVHVDEDQKSKGDALDYGIHEAMKICDYDAYIIVDADCMIDKKFLEEMNNALATGAEVIESKKLVKNYLSNDPRSYALSAYCNGLIWTMIDDMGNRYKSDRGITVLTIGTGVLMTRKVVNDLNGWPFKSMTEDLELMYQCVLSGYKTYYQSYAKVYVEEATSMSVTNMRRTRWLSGVVDTYRGYKKQLKALKGKENKRNVYWTTTLNPTFYFYGALSLFSLINFIGIFVCLPMVPSYWHYMAILCGSAFLLIIGSFAILTVACLIVEREYMSRLSWLAKLEILFFHPWFYLMYLPIIGKAIFFKEERTWDPIERIAFTNK
jgi:cellulose synthase/poly-beta-1,6-N-acetylglucosamine synthase-like glycosyltransferase